MSDLDGQLRAWREAGIVTDEQVAAITAFEAKGSPDHGRGILLAEALGYVGAAIAVAAAALLLGDRWDALNLGGRLGLIGLLTAIVAGAGFALRGSGSAPIRRLVSLLLTAGIVGVGWIVGVVTNDVLNWAGYTTTLAVGLVALVLATGLYLWRPRALAQLAMLASALTIVGGVFGQPGLDGTTVWLGLTFWAVGLGWALLGLGEWLRPTVVAVGFGAVVALVAAQIGSDGDARPATLALGLATAGALLARGVARAEAYLVTIGALGVLVFLPQLVIDIFGDAIGALITMLVVGLLLVVVSVRLARGRAASVAAKAK